MLVRTRHGRKRWREYANWGLCRFEGTDSPLGRHVLNNPFGLQDIILSDQNTPRSADVRENLNPLSLASGHDLGKGVVPHLFAAGEIKPMLFDIASSSDFRHVVPSFHCALPTTKSIVPAIIARKDNLFQEINLISITVPPLFIVFNL